RRNGLRIEQVVGLVGLERSDKLVGKLRRDLGAGVGKQDRGPVFVGDAEPGAGRLKLLGLFLLDIGVGVFLEALVAEYSDHPFVQDVVAEGVGGAMARDQAIGIE